MGKIIVKNAVKRGYCNCGCGQKTQIITHTNNNLNKIKGECNNFITGHHTKNIPKTSSQKEKMSITRKIWYKNNPDKAELKNEKTRLTNIKRGTHKNEKNVNWYGGISKLKIKRTLTNNKKEEIKKRDGYRCQECFRNREELEQPLLVHHIDFDKLNDEDNNLITLCNPCHSKLNYNRENWINHFQNVQIQRGII